LRDNGAFVVAWESVQDGFGFGISATVVPPLAVFDFDGDGAVGALTDGLLFLRDAFGFTGPSLTAGALGSGCIRCDPTAVGSYIDALGMELDIDGNGSIEALTDALLLVRHRFGFTGATLTTGAVGNGCLRCIPAQIEPYIGARVAVP
jgi:hypothetical protein